MTWPNTSPTKTTLGSGPRLGGYTSIHVSLHVHFISIIKAFNFDNFKKTRKSYQKKKKKKKATVALTSMPSLSFHFPIRLRIPLSRFAYSTLYGILDFIKLI